MIFKRYRFLRRIQQLHNFDLKPYYYFQSKDKLRHFHHFDKSNQIFLKIILFLPTKVFPQVKSVLDETK